MPVIQDAYSINVSNRFDLGYKMYDQEEDSSDTGDEFEDPLEQLKQLEEQKERERELKKQLKVQQGTKKPNKKGVQFKENKDANVPVKKDSFENSKDNKSGDSKRENAARPSKRGPAGGDRQYSGGDENKRPPRRRIDQRRDRGSREGTTSGDGDQAGKTQYEQSSSYGKSGSEGEGRAEKRDRAERHERFRGMRGGFRGERSQVSGPRSYRGGYRSDGRDDRGKREFDRRSGSDRSGVRPQDKRDGGGSRNWGTPGNEIEERAEVNSEEIGNWADHVENEQQNETKEKRESAEEGNEKKDEEEDAAKEEEEEESEMTLDEWKAMQNAAVTKKQEFNIRKAGEGEDNAKWKNMKVLHSSNSKNTDQATTHEDGHRRQVKTLVEVDIHFAKDSSMRGGRGGGRGRGSGRGRGTYRGGNRSNGSGRFGARFGQQLPPDVLNEAEFPTLPAV